MLALAARGWRNFQQKTRETGATNYYADNVLSRRGCGAPSCTRERGGDRQKERNAKRDINAAEF